MPFTGADSPKSELAVWARSAYDRDGFLRAVAFGNNQRASEGAIARRVEGHRDGASCACR